MSNLLQSVACVPQWETAGVLVREAACRDSNPVQQQDWPGYQHTALTTARVLRVAGAALFVSRPRKDGDTHLAEAQPAEQTIPCKTDPFAWPPTSWPWTRPNLFHFSPAKLIPLQNRLIHVTRHFRISVPSIHVSPWSFQNISYESE